MQNVRWACFLVFTTMITTTILSNQWWEFSIYYTNNMLVYCWLYAGLAVYLQSMEFRPDWLLVAHHLLQQLTLFGEIFIPLVYWPLLYKVHIE